MEKVKLEDITINLDKRRKPLNSSDREKISIKKIYPYCGANNIMDYVDEYLFNEEILCIAEDGGKWGKNETCSYIMNEKCWVNNHAHVIKSKEILDIRYLKYWLNYKDLNPIITGAIVRKLTQKALNNIEIILPSKEKQTIIANKLDKVQEVIYIRKKQIEELERLIKSQFVEMFGSVELNEKNFKEREISSIADISSSKRIYANEYQENGVPFYRSKEIIELEHNRKPSIELFISVKRYEEIKEKYGIPHKGDILITAVGTIGKTWIVDNDEPFYYKDGNVLQIRLNTNISQIYFKYVLDRLIHIFKSKNVSGSAYSALTIEKFKKMKIILPPIELQNKFAEIVKQIDKQKFEIQKNLEEMKKLQESLMNKYFG